LGKIEKGV